MAQFDVYRNPVEASARNIPFLLDVQSDLLRDLATRVVVPLARPAVAQPMGALNPVLLFKGEPLLLLTQELAGVPLKRFKPPVGNLRDERAAILGALDFVISGY